MTDFHSHILPSIDDGSQSVQESIDLLKEEKKQGVSLVAATPHFNLRENSSVEEFLQKREKAYKNLKKELTGDLPKILLGAEVEYFYGISGLENLKLLCLQNTELLLLEMPFEPWSKMVVNEVKVLAKRTGIIPVLAHIDRYLRFQSADTLKQLLMSGVIFQANAEAFLGFFTRGRMLKMLEHRQIGFLGSDCHNMKFRPPRLGQAVELISKKHNHGLHKLYSIEQFYK